VSTTTARQVFIRPLWADNPVLVQTLGMCPTLAITTTLVNGFAMGLATTFVMVASSAVVSSMRKRVPFEIRISTYIMIIASFVTVADLGIAALFPDIYQRLGAFIALIVANCIPLARQEAFASRNPVGRAVLDALGSGFGFTFALLLVSGARELLGYGSLAGWPILGPSFEPWVIMILPPGGFFMLGFYLLAFSWWAERKQRRAGKPAHQRFPHPVTSRVEREGQEVKV
jgi:electron transport complex protein RnfE